MKILAIGDFHGKLPKKLFNKIKKENPELILSTGDFLSWGLKKIFFKKVYKNPDKELWEIVGKNKFKKELEKDLKQGEKIIKKLNKLNLPVLTTIGNYDHAYINDQYREEEWGTNWNWLKKDFLMPIIEKYQNIKRIDYSFSEFENLIFIGAYGGSSPGDVKSKAYKKYKKKLDKLFRKFRKENKGKKVILLTHNMPYKTKLDKVKYGPAKGEHYGSKLIKRVIKIYQPILAVGGHIHENQGRDKIKKTILVNPGASKNGGGAIIEIKKKKIKSVRFIK